ncbi:MAG TPA: type II secretion system protein [bacterium]|nr:type II secretion system protein [bacterium]
MRGGQQNKKAFTLIETMVSVAIFAILIVSATNIFLSIIRSQRNTLSAKNAQESISYVLESMAKEIRMAKIDDGSCITAGKVYQVENDGKKMKFRNYQNICVTYELEESSQRMMITRGDGHTAFMTPANIAISQLSFVIRHEDIKKEQPIVTIRFTFDYFNNEAGRQSMQIQTSISSRSYENYSFGG